MNVMTRVRSLCHASTCRSNISRAWSAKAAGTPAGWSNAGAPRACVSARWMRRSMSRTASRYSPSRAASLGTEAARQGRGLVADRIEEAAAAFRPGAARGGVGAAAVAEHPFEHHPGVVLHRQRGARPPPRDGVAVGATVAAVAGARALVARLQGQLERPDRRVRADLPRDELIEGDVGEKVVPLLSERPRNRAGEKLRRAPPVNRAASRGESVHVLGQPAQHQQPVAERRQRGQNRREREPRAGGARRPLIEHDPVRDVDDAEPRDRPRRGPGEGGRRRHHAVEQRQGHRRPHPAQHRPAGNRLPDDDHDSDLRIRNGALSTTPRISDDHR